MGQLILLRHGQSVWNLENKFTGTIDVDLTEQGIFEAKNAGLKLKDFKVTSVFVSELLRAKKTAEIVIESASWSKESIKIISDKALNERNYGSLQGMNKDEAIKQFGPEQVALWRRSYEVKPPQGESLKDTCDRVIPFYIKNIEPLLKSNEVVLVVAHGNSLRGLLKKLKNIADSEIDKVDIATGEPLIFEINSKGNII